MTRWESAATATAAISGPLPPVEIAPLRDFAARLEAAFRHVASCAKEEAAATSELIAAAAALRAAAEGEVCPTCGVPLDPERLLARAAAGLEGHGHD